ncbi:MAG: hypothetical protein IJ144_00025 [Prevotella sp.]|nr:hypothetical protein [Prevotella sp.]
MKIRNGMMVAMAVLMLAACAERRPRHIFTDDMLLPMTPVKDQGRSELCWAYAMLATIETEHLLRGDSVNLSPVFIGRMLKTYQQTVTKEKLSQRAMGQTLLNMIGRYGVVPYDVLPDDAADALKTPKSVFMLGARYTPGEFGRSVCAPGEYVGLTCFPDSPYYKMIDVPVPDNWEHNRLLNVPMDTLQSRIDSALLHRHPVCWESRGHAMAIVGMAHSEQGRPYYIMKNSWGSDRPYRGLVYVSYKKMWRDMIALYLTRKAYEGR